MQQISKKRGRPLKPSKPGERASLGLRVSGDLKQRLDQAATAAGRTQGQEAELRLERSFYGDSLLPELMEATFGTGLAGILLILGRVMREAGQSTRHQKTSQAGADPWLERPWIEDPDAFDEAAQAAQIIIDEFRPEEERTMPRGAPPIGSRFANTRLWEVINQGAPYPGGWKAWIDTARRLLGPELMDHNRHVRDWAKETASIEAARRAEAKDDTQ